MKSLKNEQKKYKVTLAGGDTTKSNILSFTFVMVGYAKNAPIQRNNVKKNDDIYVTGNLGDPYIGLNILKNKMKCNKVDKKYFIKSYYQPQLQLLFSKKIHFFANSCIDISDGLFQDLNHLFYNNNLDYFIDNSKIPISNKLKLFLNKKRINKINVISKGDDYQILFTSPKKHRKQIKKFSRQYNTKVTRIGKVKSSDSETLTNIDRNVGYIHNF